MKKILLPFILILQLLFTAPTVFSETKLLSFSGQLESRYACGVRGENAGRCITGGFFAQGELDGTLGNSRIFVDGTLEYNPVTLAATNQFIPRLREAWFDYTDSWFSFRIGRQISAWGAADGLIVADVLCPQNDNAFLAKNISESRLGIDAARFSLTNSFMIFDAYIIPFFTPEEIPSSKNDLLYQYVFSSSTGSIEDEKPEVSLANMEYALRLSTYLSAMDFSFYGFYGFQDMPIMQISGINMTNRTVSFKCQYKKYFMAGLDASIPAGDFTIRTEAAFFPQKYFSNTSATGTEQRSELKALLGLDWIHESWTITGQYYADWIAGSVSEISEKAWTHKGTLNISYSLDQSNLEFSGAVVVDFKDFDSSIKLGVSYGFSDAIKFNLSAILFNPGPENQGTYGNYKDLTCVVLKGTYSF